jgi:hypothetical protein
VRVSSDTNYIKRAFSGGEIAEEAWGRANDPKFVSGVALMRNYVALPHGPAANRPGTAFVKAAKFSGKRAVVRKFVYSSTQSMVLEFGDGYIRFHTDGATLLAGSPAAWSGATPYVQGNLVSSGGVNYYARQASTGIVVSNAAYWYPMPTDGTFELPSGYLEADLFSLNFEQSADILTISHPNYPQAELRRLGATYWVLVNVSYTSSLATPAAPTVVATGAGAISYQYKVTGLGATGQEESLGSAASVAVTNNLATAGNYNTVSWTTTGAIRYNVFKLSNGLYGYIGQTDQLSFVDDNIIADVSHTPPIASNPFPSAGYYPATSAYSEQRRWNAGSTNEPQNLRASRTGTDNNFSYSLPAQVTDGINVKLAGREVNAIRHIVPLQDLLLLTSSSEWRVRSVDGGAIAAETLDAKPQAYNGASTVQPQVLNQTVVYSAARGNRLRAITFNGQSLKYESGDLCLRASHLFDDYAVVDMALMKTPFPCVWVVRDDGTLLGMTFIPEQEVLAFHRHDTNLGVFESCCVVPEGGDDALYVVVKRTINGADVRYIERFSRRLDVLEDSFFVDCGATYLGAPVTTISGATWLEGCEINVLADGAKVPNITVVGGSFTLPVAASAVHFGLPIQADLRMLPPTAEGQGGRDTGVPLNVARVWLRVVKSSSVFAGPSFDNLTEVKQRTDEPWGSPPRLVSGVYEVAIEGVWGDGQVCIRQNDPLPSTIVAVRYEMAEGD